MASPILEFNYDISCPMAYIASTRVEDLAARTNATLIWRPVLLGALYRATSAPQGAAGSASDVFNPTKKAVTGRSMQRTLRRYQVAYNPPPQHPRKTVNALRLLHALDNDDRRVLTKVLFKAYWVDGLDVSDGQEILKLAKASGIKHAESITEAVFGDARARKGLEDATTDAIDRGAFGVPIFWIPEATWTDFDGETRKGRFYWGQDRMHFVEAALLALQKNGDWRRVTGLKSIMPRCIPDNKTAGRTKVEFWYDFSSPWAFLGWTQLERLKRTFPDLEIEMKPFLLGILFREIGAPNLPMAAVSQSKALWSRQDHADWVHYWNSVNEQEGRPDKNIDFHWADIFPIRTPTVLRCAIADPSTVPMLYQACWEQNANVADDSVLKEVLDNAGFDGGLLIETANTPAIKNKLRELTAEAKANGICGVPTYRVFRESSGGKWDIVGSEVWGQDEINVVEDMIAGWSPTSSTVLAKPRKADFGSTNSGVRL
ncbi:thioredoxin-like protein [Aaosphaeria arxii CBS 175.79]|uniref:Thioredoxin-like protein n=1 Tax=Aaosphaeria arxii CBS 175.79 TaxID=1450172 RepID=A0A6A5X712_9PLEO|nr:thioredoxin-like protein [Aaosphaeria arxii CBS 175.79]KAF2008691.1 thioredoxin-like protein [Aaosphaeria arxii CBS 175.79]